MSFFFSSPPRSASKGSVGRKSRAASLPVAPCLLSCDPISPTQLAYSLGSGSLSPTADAVAAFAPTPERRKRRCAPAVSESIPVLDLTKDGSVATATTAGTESKTSITLDRSSSFFLRAGDLELSDQRMRSDPDAEEIGSISSTSSAEAVGLELEVCLPNLHYGAPDPPPGMAYEEQERWICLSSSSSSSTSLDALVSPIAPRAIARLAAYALEVCLSYSMWTPDTKTKHWYKSKPDAWMCHTFTGTTIGASGLSSCASLDPASTIAIWNGRFADGQYGSELPAIRAAGIVPMSPRAVLDLLVDSTRVLEYNKLSLGRKDLVVLANHLDGAPHPDFGASIVKIIQSQTKVLRKTMTLTSLLHAHALADQAGYIVTTRAVQPPSSTGDDGPSANEIMLGVNLLISIEGHKDTTLMINVNHVRSSLVPQFMAQKLGVAAACNFLHDLQKLGHAQ